ncbi:hypothetical protein [Rhizobium ruizarguesonis]|uniref:hypothetical protein n=1 Tax=Rhizobium ruizarguesonis TaxID=2081791 RepID=UPI001030D01D|nr:hypothetical protein [Rhizobium ruizarguesonis]TBD47120.1 hypothetical protein ELH17_08505 [Rhizobium ruizarguesonis]
MEALYFPNLSLPHPAWTNPNLLFFDRIQVIAPPRVEASYFDYRTRDLISAGLVGPLDPAPYAHDEEGDEMVLGYILGQLFKRRPNSPPARIHIGKISYSRLAQRLQEARLLSRVEHPFDDGWLEGPQWVIDHLMVVLAMRILAQSEDLPLITSRKDAKRLAVGRLHESTRDVRRVAAVAKLLPVGADATIDQIVRFKVRHGEELRRFRTVINDLLKGEVEIDVFYRRLDEAERMRYELANELRVLETRVPGWDLALSCAGVAAPFLENSPYSVAAATVGFGYLVYKLSQERLQARRRRDKKLVYAALAQQQLMPGDWGGDVNY